jgi:hypothetical protein
MSLDDDLQQTWQSQREAQLRVEPELLLQELRRNQRNFKAVIFWRDFREVFVAAVMTVFFAWIGLRGDGWPWVFLGGMCFWVGGYILVDRFRRRGRSAQFGDSLLGCVEASLADVEHQIWLLKNVFWWYLLPLAIGMVVVLVSMTISINDMPAAMRWAVFLPMGLFCALVFAGVYWINQVAVRKELEPRRQELLAVRENLIKGDE